MDISGITIKEPARSLEVRNQFDVVVVGGGIAGVAAAVAAAREGVSVCLLDKESGLGGLATLGQVTVWLPICDGMGRQIIGGIGEELLRLSASRIAKENHEACFTRVPACWEKGGKKEERKQHRFSNMFNPALYNLLLEKWVLDARVHLLYDTRVCAVKRSRNAISHVIVENKAGRYAIACGTVVDASGDADVCQIAGEETEISNANVACGWFYYLREGRAYLSLTSQAFDRNLDISKLNCAHYRVDDPAQVTQMLVESHQLILRDTDNIAKQHPGEQVEPIAIPSIPCFRATRRLVGEQSLAEADMHQWFADTVALTPDWRRKGPVFAITKRMLQGVANNNLLVAGRCLSADKTVWDCTRVIPTCAVTGEACGRAAALAVRTKGGNVRRLSASALRTDMKKNGNLVSEKLVRPAEG